MTRQFLTFREAVPDDADLLTGICQRAKASHGYDQAMMDLFLGDGDMVISAESIERDGMMLALIGDRAVGFAHLMPVEQPDTIYLENLFIEPDAQGAGVGRALMNWALVEAGQRGIAWLEWDSDPNAAAFYRKMGGEQISQIESTLFPGRIIPKFRRRTAPLPSERATALPHIEGQNRDVDITFRRVVPKDGDLLAGICRRAKASLGYDDIVLDLWASQGDMVFDPALIDSGDFILAIVGDRTIGFAHVIQSVAADVLILDDLYVEPGDQGNGIGRALFNWAMAEARDRKCTSLEWDSDPLAAGFYHKIGAKQIAENQSDTIPRRLIPRFRLQTM